MKHIINRHKPIFLSYNYLVIHIKKIIWAIAISLIIINGIYYSFKLKFPQFKIFKILKTFFKKEKKDGLSSKDTLIMSLASKIGAGSIAGISYALYYGGIGTIFWIWISTFFSSINCYIENILSILYKEKDGIFYKSGPSYYILKGLNNKKLAVIYSIIALFTYIFGFLPIQNNTITTLIYDSYKMNKILISLLITTISALVFIKGIKSISKLCNKIVPLMSFIYISLGLIVIIKNINQIPIIVLKIVKEAFNKNSISGGIIYTMIIGIQKSIFSTEAGVGTSAIISGTTSNNDYIKQGNIGIIETYFINIFITTLTSFIIIFSNALNINIKNINGIEITKYAFINNFGNLGNILLIIILVLFSFSSIITIYYYGENSLNFLTKKVNNSKILKILTILVLFLGGIISSNLVWDIADILLGLLAIINTYSIYKLRNKLKNML